MCHQATLKDVSPVISQVVILNRANGCDDDSSDGWNDIIGSRSVTNLNIQTAWDKRKQLTHQIWMMFVVVKPFIRCIRQIRRPDRDRNTVIREPDAHLLRLWVT